MLDFEFHCPTKIYFGKGKIDCLPQIVKEYGKKVLLLYGGGSIKKNGIYDKVISLMDENDIIHYELSGVEPNPKISTIEKAVSLCREHEIDVLLPVGGGSTIDSSKAIAAAVYYDGPAWDVVKSAGNIKKALPIVSVLTIAATASEMNGGFVAVNDETKEKLGNASPLVKPKASILDPHYTITLPAFQTAAGVADIMSHTIENYFKKGDGAYFQDKVAEGVLKTCIKYAPIAVREPDNYEARANIMWAGSWAHNDFIATGKAGSWSCHPMEHQLSGRYDTTHGANLAILTPRWLQYILSDDTVGKLSEFGKNVWDIDPTLDPYEIAKKAAEATYDFFESLGLPMHLSEVGVDEDSIHEMAVGAVNYKAGMKNAYVPLTVEDVTAIYKACM